ncbi:hypothetical protein SGGMMB4_01591 [Sodalis glossinidius str. 'morsitans']|uniref:PD-(D/E)XK endonuclease-like domain-containing protein n=1 Tax=Sodalis glossinidius (strain morsitans) TaxID=343509 RepID=A0A193QH52_SODGM|nr:hypothetical protein [Sodalis glossinidius]CRL44463.1 hypothetical protein SGGMMB4_01591 [Sodalis glossinidius str. 'morsitans']
MIRISATNLEAFRRWKANPDAELDEIVNYLLKKTPPTEAMAAGSAFHKVLETASLGELNIEQMDGFTFDFSKMESEIALPATRERKLTRQQMVNGERVTFVGIVDAMDATTIYDHKLTGSLDPENYTDSLQWRCYLDWFSARKFTYNLFSKYQPAANPGTYLIKQFMPISFYAYPNMHRDVMAVAEEFIEFIKEYVPELIKDDISSTSFELN